MTTITLSLQLTAEPEQIGSSQLPSAEVVGNQQDQEIIVGRNVLNRLKMLLDGPTGRVDILDG